MSFLHLVKNNFLNADFFSYWKKPVIPFMKDVVDPFPHGCSLKVKCTGIIKSNKDTSIKYCSVLVNGVASEKGNNELHKRRDFPTFILYSKKN